MSIRNVFQAVFAFRAAVTLMSVSLIMSACGRDQDQTTSISEVPRPSPIAAGGSSDVSPERSRLSKPVDFVCESDDTSDLIGLATFAVYQSLDTDAGWASGQEKISWGSGVIGSDTGWSLVHVDICESDYFLLSDNRSGAGRITDVLRIRDESLRPGQSFDHVSCRDEQGYTGYLALVKTRSDGEEQPAPREVIKAWRVGSDDGRFIAVPDQELKGITCPGESPDDP
jgi:hypothetical protein